jgi:Family of unknown function (DUF6511)
MGEISKREDAWLQKATDAAITGARKMAAGCQGLLPSTPVSKLTDLQWGWIITQVIFEWITVRVEQATEEGLDMERTVRMSGIRPDPCDVGAIATVLPKLGELAIDWSKPLGEWSRDEMLRFLGAAHELIQQAMTARDRGPGGILRQRPEVEARKINAAAGNPLMTGDELNDEIGF